MFKCKAKGVLYPLDRSGIDYRHAINFHVLNILYHIFSTLSEYVTLYIQIELQEVKK